MFKSSRFEAHADASGISLVLEHPEEEGSRKSVHMRIHFELVADILSELAPSIDRVPLNGVTHRSDLAEPLSRLQNALGKAPAN